MILTAIMNYECGRNGGISYRYVFIPPACLPKVARNCDGFRL